MAKRIAIVGKPSGDFSQVLGYLDCLVDLKVLGEPINSGEVWKLDDLDLWFPKGDERFKVLQSLTPNLPQQRYVAFMAEVLNEAEADRMASKLCERYELEHRIYDS